MNPLADIGNICFLDTETRALPGVSASDGNVKEAGTYRYAKSSYIIILTYSIGGGPVQCEETWDRHFFWDAMPDDLRAFHRRVEAGEAWYAAFNAGFDRNAWNGVRSFPRLQPEHMIDIMAQAAASNLAPSLEGVARSLKLGGKQDDGKKLIKLFCTPAGGGTPQTHPEEWRRFKSYAARDTALLPEIFRRTRALPFHEWREYWASERINERGVNVDMHFVERAAAVADADAVRSARLLRQWTDGVVTAVTQAARIATWVYDRLSSAEARELLVKVWDEDADASNPEADRKPDKLGIDRHRIEALLAWFDAQPQPLSTFDQTTVDVLVTRRFGGGSSPFKFRKMLDQHDAGLLKGQYVFNGAAQTQRFSSKGVQVHNLTRSTLGEHEAAAIEMISELEIRT